MANAVTALFEGIKTHKLEITKPIAITTGAYGGVCGLLFIIFSSARFRQFQRIPDFLQVKPRAEGKEVS